MVKKLEGILNLKELLIEVEFWFKPKGKDFCQGHNSVTSYGYNKRLCCKAIDYEGIKECKYLRVNFDNPILSECKYKKWK